MSTLHREVLVPIFVKLIEQLARDPESILDVGCERGARNRARASFPGVSLIPMYCHAFAAKRLMKIPRS